MPLQTRGQEQLNSVFGHGAAGDVAAKAAAAAVPTELTSVPDTPVERLCALLGEATAVAQGLENALSELTSSGSTAADALMAATKNSPWEKWHEEGKTMFQFSPVWSTDVVEAKSLAMFAYMAKARRVLEVGMFTGYATLTIAETLPADAQIVTLEIDPFLADFARPFFNASGHGDKIDVRVGPALEAMQAMEGEAPFDVVFIDADKGNYLNYFNTCLDLGLLAPGGVICVDNTLFKGQAYLPPQHELLDPFAWNAGGAAVAAFNDALANDPRIERVTLPLRDGVTIARLKDSAPPATPVVAAAGVPTTTNDVEAKPAPAPAALAPAPTTAAPAPAVPPAPTTAPPTIAAGSVLDRMRLDSKTALVTGGGQGIGRAYCHALAEAGASVAVVDLNQTTAEAVAEELRAKGSDAFALAADVTSREAVEGMVAACVARWGQLHIAVNNAGINRNSAAEDTPMSDWDATFNLNTRAVFECMQVEGRHMLAQGYGKIINTASMSTLLVPHPQKQAAYNCSKAAVVKLTQTVACEWADRGVRVNCISPGIVNTPLIRSPELAPLVKTWLDQIPMGRLAEVEDLQAAIVYLASDASDYMVGHNLSICGGQELW